jgi:hypothetical protein
MRRLVALLALATAVACGGDSTSPSATVTGSYSLRTVNGSPVPYTVIQIGADKYEIVSDVVTINEGGTWSETGTDRTTQNGQVTNGTITDGGTYTLNGTAITFVSTESGTVNGSVGGGTLTITAEGLALVYQK